MCRCAWPLVAAHRWDNAGMLVVRCVLVALLVVSSTIAVSAKPASACSCFGDPIQAAETVGFPDLVFTGTVSNSGPSNVTAQWSQPPEPGLALLVEVDEVRRGEIGRTVVVHTPGGPANNGNCSIGVVAGLQLFTVNRDELGHVRGGMCSVVPIATSPDEGELDAVFGPPMPPRPDIEPEPLTAGVAMPPDPEDIGAREVFVAMGGELDFSTTPTSRPTGLAEGGAAGVKRADEVDASNNSLVNPFWLAAALVIVFASSIVLARRRASY